MNYVCPRCSTPMPKGMLLCLCKSDKAPSATIGWFPFPEAPTQLDRIEALLQKLVDRDTAAIEATFMTIEEARRNLSNVTVVVDNKSDLPKSVQDAVHRTVMRQNNMPRRG